MNILNSKEQFNYLREKYYLNDGNLDAVYSKGSKKAVHLRKGLTVPVYVAKGKKYSFCFHYIISILRTKEVSLHPDVFEAFKERFSLDGFNIVRVKDSAIVNKESNPLKISFRNKTIRVPYFLAVNMLSGINETTFKTDDNPFENNKKVISEKKKDNVSNVKVVSTREAKPSPKTFPSVAPKFNFVNKSTVNKTYYPKSKQLNRTEQYIYGNNCLSLSNKFKDKFINPKDEFEAGFAFFERNNIIIKKTYG